MKTNTRLTNAQLEILKMFTFNLNDKELSELKGIFQKFLIDKLDRLTDEVWSNKNLNDEKIEAMLNQHKRTLYSA